MTTCTEKAATSCVVCSRARPDIETVDGEEVRTCTDGCEHTPVEDGWFTCDRCARRMKAALSDLPSLVALSAGELEPGRTGGAGGAEVSIGVRIDALDIEAECLGVLATWQVDWTETLHGREVDWTGDDIRRPGQHDRQARDPNVPALQRRGVTLTKVVGWLLNNLDTACQRHPAIDEFSREVGRLWAAANAASRSTPRHSWVVPCPADVASGLCGAMLKVSGEDFDRTEDGRSVPKVVVCPGCSSHWQVDRLLLVVHSTRGGQVWMAPEETAMLMGISERGLRRLAQEHPTVLRDRGRYELGSVRAALKESAERGSVTA